MKAILRVLGLALVTVLSFAQTNSWTNSAGGNWDETNSWSLGILPDSSQSVFIMNTVIGSAKIDSTTAALAPNYLRISDLTISAMNVAGPYTNSPGTASSYTNFIAGLPQLFFG